jgi:retron-type reverse transcriptase
LIAKWLTAGVLEDGRVIETEEGTPQGAVISPLLANIFLHHVYDQWLHQWRQRLWSRWHLRQLWDGGAHAAFEASQL